MELMERFTSAAIDKHLSWLTSLGRSPNTLKAYKADLGCLLEVHGEFDMDSFENVASLYLNAIRIEQAPKTVVRKLGTFRGFGKKNGFPKCLAEYRAPTPGRAIPHPVKGGVESLLKMHAVAESEGNIDLMAIIALCGFQGLRLHEALASRPSDMDFTNFTLKIRGKGDKTRVIPLFPKAFTLLAKAFAVASVDNSTFTSYSDRGARYAITRAGMLAGLGAVSSHDLRSTFGTEGFRKSKDLRAMQELMGHASSSTTEGYTFISLDDMRAAGEL